QVSLAQLDELYPEYPLDSHPPILSPDEWTPPRSAPPGGADARGGTSGTSGTDSSDPADRSRLGDPVAPPGPTSGTTRNWLAGGVVDEALEATELALGAVPDLLGSGEGI